MKLDDKYRVKQESTLRDGGFWDWSMWIEATDADLAHVQSATYGLHPAFPNPNRVIRAPSSFRLDMSSAIPQDRTWGGFEVRVTLVLANGKRETQTVLLNLALPGQIAADPLLPLPPDADYMLSIRYYKLLKQKSAFGYAREVLQHAAEKLLLDARKGDPGWVRDQQLWMAQQRALCTYKDPSLPNDQRLKDALEILLEDCGLNLQSCDDPETLGLGGAIYKRIWDVDRARANLELALAYYRRGYQVMLAQPNRHDYDGGAFTGANVIYVCDVLALATPVEVDTSARSAHLAEADDVRRQLVKILPDLLRKAPNNGWLASTLLGVYFDLGCQDASYRDKAREMAGVLRGIDVDPWERQSTGSQLLRSARLQKALGRGRRADIDALRKDVLQIAFGDFNFDHDWFEGKLGLALSGGGFRASLFHIGVLARLAELDLLRHVEVISCVSGGSIVGAHYYLLLRKLLQETPDGDVSHEDYLQVVKDLLDQFLAGVQKNIRMRVGASWFANLRMIFQPNAYSRTQQLGRLYEKHLYARVDDKEGNSPRWLNEAFIVPKSKDGHENAFSPKLDNWRRGAKVPMLVLNATTLNTGRNWQFTASFMGEPISYGTAVDATERLDAVYYNEAPERWRRYRFGDAVAASSCVPALFTPIVIPELFHGRTVRLVDGGVHDNQGTRALLDQDCDAIVVSDASGQMESLPNPAHGELGVILRTNSVLQARVRVAQNQELKARERASLLRHCAFLHLRKDIEAPVQKAVVHAAGVAGAPADQGPCTEYGTDRNVQRALSRLRTDLDSFTDREAFSLMLSGYKMAEKYLTALPSHPDAQHAKKGAWDFMRVAGTVDGQDEPGTETLLHHLAVGSRLGFKVWHLQPLLNVLRVLFLAAVVLAVVGGLGYLALRDVQYPLPLGTIAKGLLIAAGVTVVGMFVPIAKAWIARARLVMNPMSTLGRIAAGVGMGLVGSLLCRLHLWTFDKLFLRLGRVR